MKYDLFRKQLEELVYQALLGDDPAISISKGRELLGFQYMNDMRDWIMRYKELTDSGWINVRDIGNKMLDSAISDLENYNDK